MNPYTVLLKINLTVICMTIFVLNQGYCPKQSIRTRQPTPEESIEIYLRCQNQINSTFSFGSNSKMQAHNALRLFCITDELPEFAKEYYKLMGDSLDATNCQSIVTFCEMKPAEEHEDCKNLLIPLFTSTKYKHFDGKNYEDFDANEKLHCLLAAFYHLRLSHLENNKSYFFEYILDLEFRLKLNKILLSHNAYCTKRKVDEIEFDHFQCISQIYLHFKHDQSVLNQVKYALLYMKERSKKLYPYSIQYFIVLSKCLDATDVQSINTYCDKQPEDERKLCKKNIQRILSVSINPDQEIDKSDYIDASDAWVCLLTAFKYIIRTENQWNKYLNNYMLTLQQQVKVNLEKTSMNPKGYLTPEQLCEIIYNQGNTERDEEPLGPGTGGEAISSNKKPNFDLNV